MEIKAAILRVYHERGEYSNFIHLNCDADPIRFGWVNASYILGNTIVTAHMRRALGTLTTWDDFIKAVDALDIDL